MDRTSGRGLLRLFKKSAEFDSEFSHNARSLIPPFSLSGVEGSEGRGEEEEEDEKRDPTGSGHCLRRVVGTSWPCNCW